MMVFNDYKDTLKSYIHDDDKLVTYKWLSKEFEVHINAAKDILKQYWNKFKVSEQLTATFLIIGQLKDDSLRIEVVRDSDLETSRNKFMKIHCEHVYSLQKSLPDIQQLAFSGEGDLRYSAIKCSGIAIREPPVISKKDNKSELENRSQNGSILKQQEETNKNQSQTSQDKVNTQKNQIPNESLSKKNEDHKEKSGKLSKEKQVKKKAEGKKSNGDSQKKENKLNFFGAKSKEAPKGKVSENKKETEHASDESQKNDPELELSKQADEKVPRDVRKSENSDKQKPKNDEQQTETDSQKRNNGQKSKNTKSNRGTKRNRSQEKGALSKRKRIVVMDSSEDESHDSSHEPEEEPMEVVEEPVKKQSSACLSPPAEKRENGKRMVRKTVDKVFKDENGYLVTKREYVYEPVSDEQESVEAKKEEVKKSKPVEVKAKKQTSLMSFFKKT
ncbi:hypothetical protein QAD02_008530 [Eretmocerus hayati]|uniref:Uncharacterized protein n=1 Tax=Eretmocerus hayati TaxID=131215 RepID=A0ACC2N7C9_9HYME|nr:hypothetical protein QAD02_008530 [Eretmocerus hayati]